MDNSKNSINNNSKKDFKKLKRVLALLTVIFIIIILLVTLVAAFFAKPGSSFFMGMISCIIILPVIAYGYLIFYRYVSGKQIQNYEEQGTNSMQDNESQYSKTSSSLEETSSNEE